MREDGYYWVITDDYGLADGHAFWSMGYYQQGYELPWLIVDEDRHVRDSDLHQIDERRIVREVE